MTGRTVKPWEIMKTPQLRGPVESLAYSAQLGSPGAGQVPGVALEFRNPVTGEGFHITLDAMGCAGLVQQVREAIEAASLLAAERQGRAERKVVGNGN